jgi:hypothetical protein
MPTSTARRVRSSSESISRRGEREDVEQLGAASGQGRVEALSESAVEDVETHAERRPRGA